MTTPDPQRVLEARREFEVSAGSLMVCRAWPVTDRAEEAQKMADSNEAFDRLTAAILASSPEVAALVMAACEAFKAEVRIDLGDLTLGDIMGALRRVEQAATAVNAPSTAQVRLESDMVSLRSDRGPRTIAYITWEPEAPSA